jgi:CysZ protein
MRFFDNLSKGFTVFFKAIPFTFKHFGWLLLFPFLLFLLLFFLSYFLGNTLYHYVSDYIYASIGFSQHTGWFMQILGFLLKSVLFIFFKIIFFFLFYFLSGYIILILLSPLLSYISEKTEKILKQREYPFSWSVWMRQWWRSLKLSLRNMFLLIVLILLVLFITFIPLIGWLVSPFAVILIFLLNAYFFGFSFMDYSFERKNLSISQSIKMVRKNKGLTVALGSFFLISYLIPYLGYFLAPFLAIFVTVAASMAVEEIKN